MGNQRNHDEYLERIMTQLADSVLALSDQDILAEVGEAGADQDEEAERTRIVLREASQKLDHVNTRLSNLGHTINPNSWWRGRSGYHNTCATCGSFVSLTPATGEVRGEALNGRCAEINQHTIHRRKASLK